MIVADRITVAPEDMPTTDQKYPYEGTLKRGISMFIPKIPVTAMNMLIPRQEMMSTMFTFNKVF